MLIYSACVDLNFIIIANQMLQELKATLSLIDKIYSIFKFPHYELALSTVYLNWYQRPDNFIGDLNEWDEAENALKQALVETGRPWTIKEKDGAFYGPKIDIMVSLKGFIV